MSSVIETGSVIKNNGSGGGGGLSSPVAPSDLSLTSGQYYQGNGSNVAAAVTAATVLAALLPELTRVASTSLDFDVPISGQVLSNNNPAVEALNAAGAVVASLDSDSSGWGTLKVRDSSGNLVYDLRNYVLDFFDRNAGSNTFAEMRLYKGAYIRGEVGYKNESGDPFYLKNVAGAVKIQAANADRVWATSTEVSIYSPSSASDPKFNGSVMPWIDEGSDELKFRVKYSDGTVKNLTTGLAVS